MNKMRKGIRLPRENNALKKNVDIKSDIVPIVGKSPIKERPKGPIKSSELFTELFL
jgi:hypothetical protein